MFCSRPSRFVGLSTLLLATLVLVGPAQSAVPQGPVVVARGFDSPVHLAAPSNEPGRLYVVEQKGVIRVIVNGKIRAEPFLDIQSLIKSGGEQGLLSVAFHPRYAQNHLFYVDYTDTNGDTRVVEYRSDGIRAIPSSARQLFFEKQPFANHNGGQLAFGPDGLLYIGLGDGGSGGDPNNNGQTFVNKLAKIWKIDVNTPNAAAGARGVRPPQPVAVLVRPGDRRPLHRRRRPGHVGGDRLRAPRQAQPGAELRLGGLRGARAVRHRAGSSTRAGRTARRFRSTRTLSAAR